MKKSMKKTIEICNRKNLTLQEKFEFICDIFPEYYSDYLDDFDNAFGEIERGNKNFFINGNTIFGTEQFEGSKQYKILTIEYLIGEIFTSILFSEPI